MAVTQLLKSGAQISKQISLLGVGGRAYIKETRGRRYIIFKGSIALRPNLKGTRYLADNPKVRCFVVGSKDILKDAMKGTKIAIIAFVAIDVISEVTSDQPSLASLGVHLTSDVVQTVASAAMGWAAGAAILAVSPAAPVVVVFIAVVMVGFVTGMGLAYLDTHFRITERARARMMSFEQNTVQQWPSIRQQTLALEHHVGLATSNIAHTSSTDAYKVDRYFKSIAEMLEADVGRWLRK